MIKGQQLYHKQPAEAVNVFLMSGKVDATSLIIFLEDNIKVSSLEIFIIKYQFILSSCEASHCEVFM